MKVAISMLVTCNKRVDRHELIEYLLNRDHTVVYLGQDSNEEINPDFKKYNIEFLPIKMERSNTNPIKEINTLLNARKVIKDNNIDVLIAYGIRTFPSIVIAAKLSGVKHVACIVNGTGRLFQLKGLKGTVARFISYPLLCIAFSLTNNVFFQNHDDMRMIKDKKLIWKKNYSTINGSGVNLTKYYSNYLEMKPIFLMLGRLTGDKGVNEFVAASNEVKQRYPESEFYLVGPMDNDDSSLNINQLNKAISQGIINLVGKVNDVRPYINKCRVFVLPSYHEGMPRTVLEAMAMGRPIITTDAPGCRETIIEGVNGFKIPVKDKTLAEKMIWMIEHREEVQKMGYESRRICEEKFDVYKVNQTILETIGL